MTTTTVPFTVAAALPAMVAAFTTAKDASRARRDAVTAYSAAIFNDSSRVAETAELLGTLARPMAKAIAKALHNAAIKMIADRTDAGPFHIVTESGTAGTITAESVKALLAEREAAKPAAKLAAAQAELETLRAALAAAQTAAATPKRGKRRAAAGA